MTSRIVVMLPTAIGDAMMSLPAVTLLQRAFPTALISLVAERHVCSLLRQLVRGNVSCTHWGDVPLDRESGVADVLVDLASTSVSLSVTNQISAITKARHVFERDSLPFRGYDVNGLVQEAMAFPTGWERQAPRAFETAWMMDVGLVCAAIDLPMQTEQEVHGLFAEIAGPFQRGQSDALGTIFLVPGGSSDVKKGPSSMWHRAAELLRQAGFAVTVSLGPGDRDPLPPEFPAERDVALPLEQLRERFVGSKLVIANDCGPMHVACFLGCRVLAVFGPTNERIWFPYASHYHSVIRGGAPNQNPVESLGHLTTWDSWPTGDEVFAAAMEVLSH